MKKCYNCNGNNRSSDKYCRNCGYLLKNDSHYTLINLGIILTSILLLFVISLFVISYFIN